MASKLVSSGALLVDDILYRLVKGNRREASNRHMYEMPTTRPSEFVNTMPFCGS